MNITFLRTLLWATLILVTACKRQETEPQPVNKYETSFQKILTDLKSSSSAKATVLAVARPSKNWSWSGAIGEADTTTKAKATSLHRFRVASVTKMFTAVSIMMLVEENKLSLDDKISLHLPTTLMAKIISKVPNANEIRVKNLLNHTSSLGEYTGTLEFANYFLTSPVQVTTPEGAIDIGLNYSPVGSIGQFKYSNINYNLLGMIITKVSGKPYRTFVKERIFDVLKMQNSYFPSDEFIVPPYLTQYFSDGTNFYDLTNYNHNWATATGDIISTVEDLQKFIQALVQNKMVSAQSLTTMKTQNVSGNYFGGIVEGEKYGLGLMTGTKPEFVGHPGGLYGIYTNVFYVPSIDTYIVCASTGEDNGLQLIGQVIDWITSND